MSRKSDEGLMEYLNNFNRYTSEAITAAADELKRRGRSFSAEELGEIDTKIQARTKAENEEDTLWAPGSWKEDTVTDLNAPLLYSKAAIRGFSILFSVIFGATLLASNIDDTKKKCIVIVFGIIYTTTTVILVHFMPPNTYWVFLLNTAGGFGLTTTFWDKYVGKEVKYRAKPIWKPLMISAIITIPFLLAMIYG